ncbi:MAG: glycosyltransferase family 9 protein [Alphaproteobacteria bacterium]|nr:glycosyltransferase family 9 protein [Alphaproteobacteria bacterium]
MTSTRSQSRRTTFREKANPILAATGPARVVGVPTPDLRSLIAALSLARSAIRSDGGAMHLAAALAKPVVALFWDSPVERWRPWAAAPGPPTRQRRSRRPSARRGPRCAGGARGRRIRRGWRPVAR